MAWRLAGCIRSMHWPPRLNHFPGPEAALPAGLKSWSPAYSPPGGHRASPLADRRVEQGLRPCLLLLCVRMAVAWAQGHSGPWAGERGPACAQSLGAPRRSRVSPTHSCVGLSARRGRTRRAQGWLQPARRAHRRHRSRSTPC